MASPTPSSVSNTSSHDFTMAALQAFQDARGNFEDLHVDNGDDAANAAENDAEEETTAITEAIITTGVPGKVSNAVLERFDHNAEVNAPTSDLHSILSGNTHGHSSHDILHRYDHDLSGKFPTSALRSTLSDNRESTIGTDEYYNPVEPVFTKASKPHTHPTTTSPPPTDMPASDMQGAPGKIKDQITGHSTDSQRVTRALARGQQPASPTTGAEASPKGSQSKARGPTTQFELDSATQDDDLAAMGTSPARITELNELVAANKAEAARKARLNTKSTNVQDRINKREHFALNTELKAAVTQAHASLLNEVDDPEQFTLDIPPSDGNAPVPTNKAAKAAPAVEPRRSKRKAVESSLATVDRTVSPEAEPAIKKRKLDVIATKAAPPVEQRRSKRKAPLDASEDAQLPAVDANESTSAAAPVLTEEAVRAVKKRKIRNDSASQAKTKGKRAPVAPVRRQPTRKASLKTAKAPVAAKTSSAPGPEPTSGAAPPSDGKKTRKAYNKVDPASETAVGTVPAPDHALTVPKAENEPTRSLRKRKRTVVEKEIEEDEDEASSNAEQDEDDDEGSDDEPAGKKSKRSKGKKHAARPAKKAKTSSDSSGATKVKKAAEQLIARDFEGIASGHGYSTNKPNGHNAETPWQCGVQECASGMTWFHRNGTAGDGQSVGRKAISHFFGRNKKCTRSIPDNVWHYLCRKHYQREKYAHDRRGSKTHPHRATCLLAVENIETQLVRLELWRPQATFRVQFMAAADRRIGNWFSELRTHQDRQAAEAALALRWPPKAVPTPEISFPVDLLEHCHDHFLGNNKSFADIRAMLTWMSIEINNGRTETMFPLEFLLNDATEGEITNDVAHNYQMWEHHVAGTTFNPAAAYTPGVIRTPKRPAMKLKPFTPIDPDHFEDETTSSDPVGAMIRNANKMGMAYTPGGGEEVRASVENASDDA